MYSTGRSYTLWSPFGILITVWLLTEAGFLKQWELQHFESCCIYVKSEKDMVPFYAFLIYVENANQVLDSSLILGICARVGRRMTRVSAKRTAVFSAVRGVN